MLSLLNVILKIWPKSISNFFEFFTQGDSPEVGPLEILRVSFLLGNGQAPSDIPSDTKNSIRVVH